MKALPSTGYTSRVVADNGRGTEPAMFHLYTPAQLIAMPAPVWLVEPFLREGCITELFGKFGVYKSFTAAAWASEAPGLAVYVSAEGSPHDLGATFKAWEHAAGRSAGVLCLPQPVNRLGPGQTAEPIEQ